MGDQQEDAHIRRCREFQIVHSTPATTCGHAERGRHARAPARVFASPCLKTNGQKRLRRLRYAYETQCRRLTHRTCCTGRTIARNAPQHTIFSSLRAVLVWTNAPLTCLRTPRCSRDINTTFNSVHCFLSMHMYLGGLSFPTQKNTKHIRMKTRPTAFKERCNINNTPNKIRLRMRNAFCHSLLHPLMKICARERRLLSRGSQRNLT